MPCHGLGGRSGVAPRGVWLAWTVGVVVISPDSQSGERRFESGTVYLKDIKIEKLNFDQFHALDHWPASRYCFSQYGGPIRHMRLAWEYRWRGRLICWTGWHDWADSSDSNGWTGKSCWFCMKHKE